MGGPPIYRERNLTQLTERGRVMLPHLETTFAAAEAAKRLADSVKRHERLMLKVGLAPAIPASLLCPSLAERAGSALRRADGAADDFGRPAVG